MEFVFSSAVEYVPSLQIAKCTSENDLVNVNCWIEFSGPNHAVVIGPRMSCGVRLEKIMFAFFISSRSLILLVVS